MKLRSAHDVRNLRACACGRLDFKDRFLTDGRTCLPCAWEACDTIHAFIARHPRAEWAKLWIGLIGAENMRILIRHVQATE